MHPRALPAFLLFLFLKKEGSNGGIFIQSRLAIALTLCLALMIALPVGIALSDSTDDQIQDGVLSSSVDDFTFSEVFTTTGSGSSAVTTLTGYGVSAKTTNLSGDVVIPDSYKDLPVVRIDTNGFRNCYGMTSVLIPHTIKTVGANAFTNCIKLNTVYYNSNYATTAESPYIELTSPWYNAGSELNVVFGNTVTAVSPYCFFAANHLKSVTLSPSTGTIGVHAFDKSSLESITIEHATKVDEYAFKDCKNLNNLVLPDSLIEIGVSAFQGCSALESINIPKTVTKINNLAFADCTKLATINYNASAATSVSYTNTTSAWLNVGKDTEGVTVILSDDVTVLPSSAFSYFENLHHIVMNQTLTKIDSNSFYNCINLEEITIPASVTALNSNAFYNCYQLSTINYNASAATGSISGSNIGKDAEDCVLVVGDSVTALSKGMFSNLDYYGTVYYNAPAVADISLGSSDTSAFGSIGYRLYYDDPNKLAKLHIIIGDNVTNIPSGIFYKTYYLKELTIGESVISIANNAFSYCSRLATINYNAVAMSDASYDLTKSPWGSATVETQTGKDVTGGITLKIGENVRYIPEGVFHNLVHLANVEFNAKNLNEKVYTSTTTPWYNVGLSESDVSVTVGDNVTQIPAYAFAYFTSLKKASIGALVESIGNQAFAQTSLETITMPKTVQYTASSFPSSAEVTKLDTFTVSYSTNGGSEIASHKILQDRVLTKPADPTKDGFTFAGWYSDAELTSAYDFTAPVTQDITLYASWTVNSTDNPSDKPTSEDLPSWVWIVILLLCIVVFALICKVML